MTRLLFVDAGREYERDESRLESCDEQVSRLAFPERVFHDCKSARGVLLFMAAVSGLMHAPGNEIDARG